ncbi:MAG: thermonuclease family protein [Devosia sp.]
MLPRLPRFRRLRLPGPIVVAFVAAMFGISFFSSGDLGGSGVPPVQRVKDGSVTVKFSMCGSNRYTCVVDGDTIWWEGQNLRLQSYDTPEPYNAICGGAEEVALAKRASARLLELLNGNPFTVQTFGLDNTGKRTLATIRIGGRDVGDILIKERLARRWPDGNEWWCG